jgi:Ni/Co efflux regulator RcnB
MKLHQQITGTIIVCLMASQSAFARDDNRRDYRERKHAGYQMKGHGHHGDRGYARGHQKHYDYRGNHNAGYPSRGAGPRHNWYKGSVLPVAYRDHRYAVNDWHQHRRLYAPPRGYHWVHVGGDYVLAAIATGVILGVLLN